MEPVIVFFWNVFRVAGAGVRVYIWFGFGLLVSVRVESQGLANPGLIIVKTKGLRIQVVYSWAFPCYIRFCARSRNIRGQLIAASRPTRLGNCIGVQTNPFHSCFSDMAILHVTVRPPAFLVPFPVLKMRTAKFMELRSSLVYSRFCLWFFVVTQFHFST